MNDEMTNTMVPAANKAAPGPNTYELVDIEGIKNFMKNYQEVIDAILEDSDYQKIQTKDGVRKFKKKSAWRKLATAFNINDTILKEEITRDEHDRIVSAKYYVEAVLPNGRKSVGVGVCSIYDKRKKTDRDEVSNFVLRGRFTNAENDVPTTAHTRAKNRAISDLIGAGDVSAEEMEGYGRESNAVPKKIPKKSVKKVTPKKQDNDDIEVKAEVVKNEGEPVKKSMTLKELMDNNKLIHKSVKELQDKGVSVNRESLKEYLSNLNENKKISKEEYEEAMGLME